MDFRLKNEKAITRNINIISFFRSFIYDLYYISSSLVIIHKFLSYIYTYIKTFSINYDGVGIMHESFLSFKVQDMKF